MERLVFSGVTRRYGSVEALVEFSLGVRSGEIYGLLGPNGAGKTTAVKLGVGLLAPDEGEVSLDGREVRSPEAEVEATVGYLPDEPLLYPKLTGREMLDLVAALRGQPEGRVQECLAGTDEPLRLDEEALSRFVGSYSHGMKRKLLLLLARLHDPDVYVLDEPTQALDPMAVRSLKAHLGRTREEGGAVLLATHDLAVAASLCDRIGILHEGRLQYEGGRDDIRERYARTTRSLERLFLEKVTSGEDPEGSTA